jgi:uncharacterized protein
LSWARLAVFAKLIFRAIAGTGPWRCALACKAADAVVALQLGPLDWAWLVATTTGAALLYTLTGFGFAVLATPVFLLFIDPPRAVQLVILMSTALSITALPRLWQAIAPALLLRLTAGSVAGLPLGLIALRHADPEVVRRVIGATILAFTGVLCWVRRRGPDRAALLDMRPSRDFAAGIISGAATALVGMAGPPVLIYLLLAGAPPPTVRATLLSFFGIVYAAALFSHAAAVGIPLDIWIGAGVLTPFAALGAIAGRPLGDRLGVRGFAILAIALLLVAGLYTLAVSPGSASR